MADLWSYCDSTFADELSKTAGEVGIESANEGRGKVWLDVELVG